MESTMNDVGIEPAKESDFDDDIADKDYELPTAKVTTYKKANIIDNVSSPVIPEKSKNPAPCLTTPLVTVKPKNTSRALVFPGPSKPTQQTPSHKRVHAYSLTLSDEEDEDPAPIERQITSQKRSRSSSASSTSRESVDALEEHIPKGNPLIPPHEKSEFVHRPGYERTHKNLLFDYYVYDQTDPKHPTAECICITKYNNKVPVVCGKILKMGKSCSAGPMTHLKAFHPQAMEELKNRREAWDKHVSDYKSGLAKRLDEKEGRTPGKRQRMEGPNIDSFTPKYGVRSKEQLYFDMLQTVWMIVGGIPYNHVEGKAYKVTLIYMYIEKQILF